MVALLIKENSKIKEKEINIYKYNMHIPKV